MQINFEKAHKLISTLEEKLKSTTTQTNQAREVLEEWRKKGEAGLRKKTAQALKLVRKKADSFADALTDLERSLAKSLDRLSKSIDVPGVTGKAKQGKKKSPKKAAPARKAVAKTAEPVAK
jgi:hypothetical protein